FKNEFARAVAQECLKQSRRRNVQVSRDALLFELKSLARPTARDNRKAWLGLQNDWQLFFAKFGWHEAKNSHAPRPAAHRRLGLIQQRPNLRTAKQCKSQERHCSVLGDASGETCDIANSRHRALSDRVLRIPIPGQRRSRCECPLSAGLRDALL